MLVLIVYNTVAVIRFVFPFFYGGSLRLGAIALSSIQMRFDADGQDAPIT